MPTLITRGAASAKAFGFTGASAASTPALVTMSYQGTNQYYPFTVQGGADGNYYQSGVDYTNGFINLIKYNGTTGAIIWQKSIAGASSQMAVYQSGIAVDSSNNVYLWFNLGGGITSNKCYLNKYNSSGVLQWQRQLYNSYVGESQSQAGGVAVNSAGTLIVVTGIYKSGGTGGGQACGVVAYNSSGTLQWQRKLRNSTNGYLWGYSVAFDTSDNIYVSGYTDSPSDQGFLLKYNSSGTIQWQRTWNGNTNRGYSVSLDSSNNIYIGAGLSPNNGTNFYWLKFNTSGTLSASKQLNSGTFGPIPYSKADASGNMYGIRMENSTPYEIRVNKLDSTGAIAFSNRITVTSGVNNTQMQPSGSTIVGNASTGLYFAVASTAPLTAGGAAGPIWVLPRDGTKTGASTITVGVMQFTYTATTASTANVTLTASDPAYTESVGDWLEAAGGNTDGTPSYSNSATTF